MLKLYTQKEECSGCAACMNICPKAAITMKPDEDGFLYPFIKEDLCVACGMCKKVCTYRTAAANCAVPLATYAAINRNRAMLAGSSSGGVFAALALMVLEKKGVIFGCAFNREMEPEHVGIAHPVDLPKLQGSKYVQSNINAAYTDAKKYLSEGKLLLFTGTPCQIAGLKSYLGRDYTNLITADLICHGVPSAAFFKGYLKQLEEGKLGGKVIDFKFRDKARGWGYRGKVVYQKKGRVREKLIFPCDSYYVSYFLKSAILRLSCYACKYAGGSRQGDFTLGDYWGVEQAHPKLQTRNGVSVLLVNSEKGLGLLEQLAKSVELTKSYFEQATALNGRLMRSTTKSNSREAIMKIWREGGGRAVAEQYYQESKKQLWKLRLKMLVPRSTKFIIKKLLKIG
jgi:coenzyme F420-reducing hydrogenase beta subunit